jgi:hypothetical protein
MINKILILFLETFNCVARFLVAMLSIAYMVNLGFFSEMSIFIKILFIFLMLMFIFYDFFRNTIPIFKQFWDEEKNG